VARLKSPWIVVAVWFGLIFLTSNGLVTVAELGQAVAWISGGRVPAEGFKQFWLQIWWFVVKGWHVAEFAALFLLLRLAFKKSIWPPIAIATLIAVSDEIHQTYIPGRGGRLSDVCLDLVGILVAAYLSENGPKLTRTQKVLIAVAVVGLIYVFAMFPFGQLNLGRASQTGL
jgi:hypothetical protein